MKKITITCDFCGRVVDFDIGKIEFDNGENHTWEGFKTHTCRQCFRKIYNIVRGKMVDKKQKNVRYLP